MRKFAVNTNLRFRDRFIFRLPLVNTGVHLPKPQSLVHARCSRVLLLVPYFFKFYGWRLEQNFGINIFKQSLTHTVESTERMIQRPIFATLFPPTSLLSKDESCVTIGEKKVFWEKVKQKLKFCKYEFDASECLFISHFKLEVHSCTFRTFRNDEKCAFLQHLSLKINGNEMKTRHWTEL